MTTTSEQRFLIFHYYMMGITLSDIAVDMKLSISDIKKIIKQESGVKVRLRDISERQRPKDS